MNHKAKDNQNTYILWYSLNILIMLVAISNLMITSLCYANQNKGHEINKNEKYLEELVEKVKNIRTVDGPVPGNYTTFGDKVNAVMSYELHKDLNKLDGSIKEFNENSSFLSIV